MNYSNSVFQLLCATPAGIEAGTAWISQDAADYVAKTFPHLAQHEDSYYCVTNAHVVRGASSVMGRWQVARRTDLPMSVLSVAADVDLAIVKLTGEPKKYLDALVHKRTGVRVIPGLKMMDSDAIMPTRYDPKSQSVTSVGYPLGCEMLNRTVGAVQAWKRVPGSGACSLYIAHTATIQPGNSGGPLTMIDPEGNTRVLAINSMKATGATTDNLNMAIPSARLMSHFSELLDGERKLSLTAAMVNLANHLHSQGTELKFLETSAKSPVVLGHPRAMEEAYAQAMAMEPARTPNRRMTDARRFPTLTSFVRGWSHRPGFHRLFAKVATLLHEGKLDKVHSLATSRNGFAAKLCDHCKQAAATAETAETAAVESGRSFSYCVSAVPSKVVHSPRMTWDYKATSALSRKALGVASAGGVVVSEVLPYSRLASKLQPYDVISHVRTERDGLLELDEQGEAYQAKWGLSLGLSDILDRAPLHTAVAMQVHRGDQKFVLQFEHTPLQLQERPPIRLLDQSEAALNASITVGGVTFKQLRLSDFADPAIASGAAAVYQNPQKQHENVIVVTAVDPRCQAFHQFSLMPGQIVEEVHRQPLTVASTAWTDFLEHLADTPKNHQGVCLLKTKGGGMDALPVSTGEAQQLLAYLQNTMAIQ